MVRHDMHLAKQGAKSEQIRLGLGLLTPAERQALADTETRRQQAAAKKAAKGTPLGLEEE
jgi:hypothetical protein